MAKNVYPVRLLALDVTDPEFAKKDANGRPATHAIEQLDGDKYLFPTQPDAERFLHLHGMVTISDSEFNILRRGQANKA